MNVRGNVLIIDLTALIRDAELPLAQLKLPNHALGMTYCHNLNLCLPKPFWPTGLYQQMNKRYHQICNV